MCLHIAAQHALVILQAASRCVERPANGRAEVGDASTGAVITHRALRRPAE
jgi:hypothetical protein